MKLNTELILPKPDTTNYHRLHNLLTLLAVKKLNLLILYSALRLLEFKDTGSTKMPSFGSCAGAASTHSGV